MHRFAAAPLAVLLILAPFPGRAAPQGDRGEDLDCVDFTTQEDAQAELDANARDPHNLDPGGDGVACSLLPSEGDAGPAGTGGGAPGWRAGGRASDDVDAADDRAGTRERRGGRGRDRDRVGDRKEGRDRDRTPASGTPDLDCADFATQEAAQKVLDADARDPHNLDPGGDGVACARLPAKSERVRVTAMPRTGVGSTADAAVGAGGAGGAGQRGGL